MSCKDPAIGCHKNEIPASEQACSNLTCGHWVTEDWVEVCLHAYSFPEFLELMNPLTYILAHLMTIPFPKFEKSC